MPRFRVNDTFEIQDANLFVMAGSIIDGAIRTGMSVRVSGNSNFAMTARIHSKRMKVWRGLNLGGETIEITTDASD